MISSRDFRPVTKGDRAFLQKAILSSAAQSCEFSFANLVMWQKNFDIRFAVHENHVYFLEKDDENDSYGLLFLPAPGAEPDPAELRGVSDALRDGRVTGTFFCVDDEYLARHADCGNYFSVGDMDDSTHEYIYETVKLAELHGEKLAKKRNLIAQFLRAHPDAHAEKLDASTLAPCLEMARLWREEHPEKDSVEVVREAAALEAMAENFDALDLTGVAAFADGRVVGFSACSPISGNLYDEHFEKSLSAYKGAAQFVNRETAKTLPPRVRYLNREQDMGYPGLRQAKLSYQPERLLRLHDLVPR